MAGNSGLKVGDLYVVLTANIGGFQKSLASVVKSIEQTAAKVEQIGQKLGAIGAAAAAGIGAAIAVAAQANPAMAAQLEKLKALMFTFAVEVGEMFAPLLDKLVGFIEGLVAWFQKLSPETKSLAADIVAGVAAVGLLAGAFGKLSGVVSAVMKLIQLGMATLGTAFLPVVAAVAVGIVLFGYLYKKWNDTESGFKAGVLRIVEWLKSAWDTVKEFFTQALKLYLDYLAFVARKLAAALLPIAEGLGLDGLKTKLKAMTSLTGDDLLKGLKKGADLAVDLGARLVEKGKEFASDVGDGLKMALADAKKLFADFIGAGDAKHARIRTKLESEKEREQRLQNERIAGSIHTAAAQPQLRIAGDVLNFDPMVGILERMAKEAADKAREALKTKLTDNLVNAFPDVKSLYDSAMAAKDAGPMAMVAAIVGDLLLKSKTFADIVQMVTNFVQFVADTLGTALAPVLPILATVFDIAAGLLKGLMQGVAAFLKPLETISAPLQLLSVLANALSPIIGLAAQAFLFLTTPLMLLVGPVMRGLFEVLRYASVAILWVVARLGEVWNGLVGGVQALLKNLATIEIAGAKPFQFLTDWSKEMEKAKVDIKSMDKTQADLLNMKFDDAISAAQSAADKWVNFGEQMSAAADSLSNVPTGWKKDLRVFQSSDPGMGAYGSSGSASQYNDYSQTTINVTVETSSGADAEDIAQQTAEEIRKAQKKENARKKGGYKNYDEGWEP